LNLNPLFITATARESDAGVKIINDDDGVTSEHPMDKVDKRRQIKSNNSL